MTDHTFKIARGLEVPLSAATQPWAFIGRRGSGKTYAAGSLVERMLDEGIQVVVLDPVSNWWALRVDESGSKPSGYDVYVLGGPHADVPLESTGGALVAEFVVETGTSVVLDLILFSETEKKRFVADFTERLIQMKSRNKSPLHVVLEEAQEFAPQHATRGGERMLGSMQRLVKLGRNWGIGVSMITQRPQAVSKEVLNQAEPLIVGQLTGPHERKAVQQWVHHTGSDGAALVDELPSLKPGDVWFWSPSWMDGTFKRTRFLKKRTLDASATPTETQDRAIELAALDLDKLREGMADTVRRAEANDPKKLQAALKERDRRIADLEQTVQRLEDAEPETPDLSGVVDVLGRAKTELDDLRSRLRSLTSQADEDLMSVEDQLFDALEDLKREPSNPAPARSRPTSKPARRTHAPAAAATPVPAGGTVDDRVLDAVAFWKVSGCTSPNRTMVAFVAGLSPTSSHTGKIFGRLRAAGLVEFPAKGEICLTDVGFRQANVPEGVITLDGYHARMFEMLRGGGYGAHARVLEFLIENGKSSREEAANGTGLSPTSSHTGKIFGKLRALGLVEFPAKGYLDVTPLANANGTL